jgi:23S rRNA pseudouridine1911/1915/1917 synthase
MKNDISSRILYLSRACVVVNKLSGEAVEGAKPGMGDLPKMLAAALAANQAPPGGLALPEAIHRLDVPVSGCAAFALTQEALGALSAAFSRNAVPQSPAGSGVVEKRYWAVVESPQDNAAPLPGAGELRHWIRFDSEKNKATAYDAPGPGRKEALLTYRLAGRGQHYLFLDINLITGRHHQIRAQLARLKLHIKGDLKYGAKRSEKDGGIRLHARSLSFPAPWEDSGSGRISVTAEPPLRDNLWLAFEDAVRLNPSPGAALPGAPLGSAENQAAAHPSSERPALPRENAGTDR